MARPFSSIDAKRVAAEHGELLSRLRIGQNLPEQYRVQILKAASYVTAQVVLNILQEIPVEEINREKRGFRVKALAEQGFSTLADLYAAPVQSIASVHGISIDSAYAIKQVVNELAEQAGKEARFRLSVDNKSAAATQLVTAVFRYKHSIPLAENCRRLEQEQSRRIRYALDELYK